MLHEGYSWQPPGWKCSLILPSILDLLLMRIWALYTTSADTNCCCDKCCSSQRSPPNKCTLKYWSDYSFHFYLTGTEGNSDSVSDVGLFSISENLYRSVCAEGSLWTTCGWITEGWYLLLNSGTLIFGEYYWILSNQNLQKRHQGKVKLSM